MNPLIVFSEPQLRNSSGSCVFDLEDAVMSIFQLNKTIEGEVKEWKSLQFPVPITRRPYGLFLLRVFTGFTT